MLAFINHKTGKIIYTQNKEEIPHVGLSETGWEHISQEEYKRIITLEYTPPSWNYYKVKLYVKIRNNPENIHLLIGSPPAK